MYNPPGRIPDQVFRGKFHIGSVAFNLLVIILNETCRSDAREWTRIPDEDLAHWAGLTTPSMEDFRRRLSEAGLIEWRPVAGWSRKHSEYRHTDLILGCVAQPQEQGVVA